MVLLASEFDKSRFLSASDLDDHEGERRFKIRDVTAEEVGKEKKLIVWFTNDEKGLVLNKTNNRVLREKFGDDVAGWIGKIIVVFSTTRLRQFFAPRTLVAGGKDCPFTIAVRRRS